MSVIKRRGFASGFYAHRNGVAQALNANAWNTAQFNTVDYDLMNEYDEAVTYYFTNRNLGVYLIDFTVSVSGMADGQFVDLALEDDATGTNLFHLEGKFYVGIGGQCTKQLTVLARLNAGTRLRPRIYVGAGVPIMAGADGASRFSVRRLR